MSNPRCIYTIKTDKEIPIGHTDYANCLIDAGLLFVSINKDFINISDNSIRLDYIKDYLVGRVKRVYNDRIKIEASQYEFKKLQDFMSMIESKEIKDSCIAKIIYNEDNNKILGFYIERTKIQGYE